MRGEFRERAEGLVNSGFVDGRDDLYYLSRFRFNATATGKAMAATVQLQDARVGNKSVGPTGTPFTASFDLRQAFVDVNGKRVGSTQIGARLGRQEIAFGDQRLVGHANWINSGRTFDAARVTLKSKPAQIDLFAASVVRILDGEFDKSGNGNRFAGAYGSSGRILPQGTAEPYVFWRRDINLRAETGALDSLQQVTTGARLVGNCPRGSTTTSRWPSSAAPSGPIRCAPGPDTGRSARPCRAPGRHTSRPNTTMRRVTPIQSTAFGARSISSTRPLTISTAWPTRWAGGTSITFASGSTSPRSRPRRSR